MYLLKNTQMKKCYLIILTAGLFTTVHSTAQIIANQVWESYCASPDSLDYVQSDLDINGRLIVSGHTVQNNQYDVFTNVYNDDGTVYWSQSFNGVSGGNDYGTAVVSDAQGNIYVAGSVYSNATAKQDYLLLKYSNQGLLLWTATYNGAANGDDVAIALQLDPQGNIYLTGTSESSPIGVNYDCATVKYNSQGIQQWVTRYDFTGLADIPTAITRDNLGHLFICAASQNTPLNSDITVIRYDMGSGLQSGVYRHVVSGNGWDNATSLSCDLQGNVYASGRVFVNSLTSDVCVLKCNNSVTLQWANTYDAESRNDGSNATGIDGAGNVFVTGFCDKQNNGRDFLTLMYNAAGTLVWDRRIASANPVERGEARKLKVENGSGVYVAGEMDKSGNKNFLAVRYDLTGKKTWEQFFDGSTGNQDRAYDVEISGTKIFVTGKSGNGSGDNYSSVCYERMDRALNMTTTSQGVNIIQNEVLVQFSPSVLKMNAVDNREKRFGLTGDFLADSMVTMISVKLGTDVSKWKLIKMVPELTSADSISTSRLGSPVRVPDFWASFILLTNGMSEEVIADSLNRMHPHIWRAELNVLCEYYNVPNDTRFLSSQFSLYPAPQFAQAPNDINVEQAWDIETGKPFVKVGIFDSGIDQINEDLDGGIVQGGYDYATQVSLAFPYDVNGHGTKCAGIIGARRNNAAGVAGIAGGDFQAGQGGVSLFDMRLSIQNIFVGNSFIFQAIVSGANSQNNGGFELHIMNGSFGSDTYSPMVHDAVKFAHSNDIIFVASRGNTGGNPPKYPACYVDEQVLSVGASAVDGSWQDYQPNSVQFQTCYGLEMDFVAPGVDTIISTTSPGQQNYGGFYGTSAAAPHVSGVAALMLSNYNQPFATPLNLAPEDVEQIIERNCYDLNDPAYSTSPGYDQYSGWGRVNAEAALKGVRQPYKIHHYANNYNLTSGSISINVNPNTVTVYMPFSANQLAPGSYICQQYEVIHTFQYNDISPTEQIVAFWPRPSSAIGLSSSSTVKFDNYCEIISCTNNQMVMRNYLYYVLFDLNGNQINQLLGAPSTVNAVAAATIYTYDSTLTGTNVIAPASNWVGVPYPNPANGLVAVPINLLQPGEISVQVYDVTGRLIDFTQTKQAPNGQSEITLDTHKYANGSYIIQIKAGENYFQRKLVVNR
jgi:subtilisin family serine protease